eukprot:GHVQ01019527.1.p1 GENE.GHVQ01019527.1~~GHVQ01019527.1.p1  ORF type:complete len:317 (+),score=11.06 GHVQ01019527.1:288-1238(+)
MSRCAASYAAIRWLFPPLSSRCPLGNVHDGFFYSSVCQLPPVWCRRDHGCDRLSVPSNSVRRSSHARSHLQSHLHCPGQYLSLDNIVQHVWSSRFGKPPCNFLCWSPLRGFTFTTELLCCGDLESYSSLYSGSTKSSKTTFCTTTETVSHRAPNADNRSQSCTESRTPVPEKSTASKELRNLLVWILFSGSGICVMWMFFQNLYLFTTLLLEYPPPVQKVWESVRNDPRVIKDMGTTWFTYNWLWSGTVNDDFARIKLYLYGVTGERAVAFGDLCLEKKTGEWKILILNFYRTDNLKSGIQHVVSMCACNGRLSLF